MSKKTEKAAGEIRVMYVVSPSWNRLGAVLFGPQRTGLLFHEPHTGLYYCLIIRLSCFRKRRSGARSGACMPRPIQIQNDAFHYQTSSLSHFPTLRGPSGFYLDWPHHRIASRTINLFLVRYFSQAIPLSNMVPCAISRCTRNPAPG